MYHVSSFDHWGAAHRLFPVNIEGYPSMFCPNPGGARRNAAVQLARLGVSAGSSAKWARMTLASP